MPTLTKSAKQKAREPPGRTCTRPSKHRAERRVTPRERAAGGFALCASEVSAQGMTPRSACGSPGRARPSARGLDLRPSWQDASRRDWAVLLRAVRSAFAIVQFSRERHSRAASRPARGRSEERGGERSCRARGAESARASGTARGRAEQCESEWDSARASRTARGRVEQCEGEWDSASASGLVAGASRRVRGRVIQRGRDPDSAAASRLVAGAIRTARWKTALLGSGSCSARRNRPIPSRSVEGGTRAGMRRSRDLRTV